MASRDHRGRWLRGVEGINRDAAALRLRAEGWSLQRISDQLAYGGKANVSEALTKAKEDIIGPPARDLIAQEMANLEHLIDKMLEVLHANHVMVSHGRLISIDERPLPDHGPVVQAANTLKGLYESRRKLLGIDAAQKLDATVHQVDQVDVELAELLRDTRARVAVQEAELRPPPDVV